MAKQLPSGQHTMTVSIFQVYHAFQDLFQWYAEMYYDAMKQWPMLKMEFSLPL